MTQERKKWRNASTAVTRRSDISLSQFLFVCVCVCVTSTWVHSAFVLNASVSESDGGVPIIFRDCEI